MKGLLGEKLGMTQVWDENNRIVPVTVVAGRPVRRHPGPHRRQRRLRRRPARLRRDRPAQGEQAARPATSPRRASRRAATWSSCAPTTPASTRSARRSPPTLFEAGQRVDVTGTSKGKGFAGVMKRHGFHGLGACHGVAAQAPLAGLDRRLRHPGPRLQGHADGRPDGRRAHHHAEPHRPRGRRREAACCSSRAPSPAPRAALVLVRTAAKGADVKQRRG